MITGNLNIISDKRIRAIVSKGPKYRFPARIDFQNMSRALDEFGNRWCKREGVEPIALKEWKTNIFKVVDKRISFYTEHSDLLPRNQKLSYRHLKEGIQKFQKVCFSSS